MPADHIILRTPTDLNDAKRQLHLAVVFLCGRWYMAKGSITLTSDRPIESIKPTDTPMESFVKLQKLEVKPKRQEAFGLDPTETIGQIVDETVNQALYKIPVGSITGEYCSACSGELRRNGSCMVCVNCGTTTGCS